MCQSDSTTRIRELNDDLRCRGLGGQMVVTQGVASLGEQTVRDMLRAVATFDAFTKDNDPYGEHDCAVLTAASHRIIWKIDYYDRSLTAGSPDPADPELTSRVMTVMLATEY